MKKVFFAVFALAFVFVACSSSDDNEEEMVVKTSNPYDRTIIGTLAKCARPSWTVADNLTYSSMTILIDEYGIPCKINETDIIASFVGGECRGVVNPIYDSGEDYWRFNLPAYGANSDESLIAPEVEIRYYSSEYGGTYSAATIAFSEGTILGKNLKGQGYKPKWN